MTQLYTTHHNNIVMKREPRQMSDTVSYMLKWELCKILDWAPDHIANKAKLNMNFARIKLMHDGYEWYVLQGQLQETNGSMAESTEQLQFSPDTLKAIIAPYLWSPYLRGGRMQTWIDCSWLTQIVYTQLGIALLRDAREQVTQWQQVQYADLTIWDLIFFEEEKDSDKIKHVGIYLWNNRVVHASEQWSANVRVDVLDERWIINKKGEIANLYVTARRYI